MKFRGGRGFHCWPQGAGPSTRSVWPILEAFSRGREAEGHVAPEQLPDGTVREMQTANSRERIGSLTLFAKPRPDFSCPNCILVSAQPGPFPSSSPLTPSQQLALWKNSMPHHSPIYSQRRCGASGSMHGQLNTPT